MADATFVDRLFRAGAHFGFKKSRRHPTVTSYLYTTKDGNDIIDLSKITKALEEAKETLSELGKQGKTVLFVGTKDEASKIVRAVAEKTESPFVTNRWIGGMLTNWSEIKKRINRLEALNHEKESGELERKYTKKERVMLGRESDKLNFNFAGIAGLQKMPDLMLVVDPRHDHIAVTEAHEKNIPVMAIMGSDSNVDRVKYPVVANDSLQSSVSLLLEELAGAFSAGKAEYKPAPKPETDRKPVRPRRS